jgi:hypothetical protein
LEIEKLKLCVSLRTLLDTFLFFSKSKCAAKGLLFSKIFSIMLINSIGSLSHPSEKFQIDYHTSAPFLLISKVFAVDQPPALANQRYRLFQKKIFVNTPTNIFDSDF